jgi:hypothetical protein
MAFFTSRRACATRRPDTPPHRQQTRQRIATGPEVEQAATSRRACLVLVLSGAVVALVVGLAMTVHQVLQRLLDVSDAGSLSVDIALPVGPSVVTAAAVAYHSPLLRRDLAVRALGGQAEGAVRLKLVLTGRAGANLGNVVRAMRRELLEGYAIEARTLPGTAEPETDDRTSDPGAAGS